MRTLMLKAAARSLVYTAVPNAQAWWVQLNERWRPSTFTGHGLTTTSTQPPWINSPDDLALAFLAAHRDLERAVLSGAFRLTLADAATDLYAWLGAMMYRNYYVFWSARHAVDATGALTLMECGSADGMSAHFALRGAPHATAHLYDAFAPMTADGLLPSELFSVGHYAELRCETTARNLDAFAGRVRMCPGVIPASFAYYALPESIAWLHVDLNAAGPTIAALEQAWPALATRALVLFDDYGWIGWEDTKRAVDRFLADKPGHLLQLPTGQAIWWCE